jgi:hypothetical protein
MLKNVCLKFLKNIHYIIETLKNISLKNKKIRFREMTGAQSCNNFLCVLKKILLFYWSGLKKFYLKCLKKKKGYYENLWFYINKNWLVIWTFDKIKW